MSTSPGDEGDHLAAFLHTRDIFGTQIWDKYALRNRARDFSAVLLKVERDMDELLQLVDEYSQSFEIGVEEKADPIKAFQRLRQNHESLLDAYNTLHTVMDGVRAKVTRLDKGIKEFRCAINRSAMNCGLTRLPDELLLLIFSYVAACSWKSTVNLTQVCKHFRSLVNGSPTCWNQNGLSSGWKPERILAIAERCQFRSLKAYVSMGSGSYRRIESERAILKLGTHLEQLQIDAYSSKWAEDVQQFFKDSQMPNLRALFILGPRLKYPMPALRFPDHACLPSLRNLSVTFIPHSSLAPNLVRCALYLDQPSHAKDVLAFLSSATLLQELEIDYSAHFSAEQMHEVHSLPPISLPNLVFLDILSSAFLVFALMEKIVPVSLRRLILDIWKEGDATVLPTSVPARWPVRELLLDGLSERIDLVLRCKVISDHLEILSLKRNAAAKEWSCSPELFKADRLRLISFQCDDSLSSTFIHSLRDMFLKAGYDAIRFEFHDCLGLKNGVFGLDDLESAFLGD